MWKVKVNGKVSKKLFTGAMWKLDNRKYEVLSADEDTGAVLCEDDLGSQVTKQANDFVPGEFLGDRYAGIEDIDE